MRKKKKLLALIMAFGIITHSFMPNVWAAEEDYNSIDNTSAKIMDSWHEIDGDWYYYENNQKVTGWKKVGNEWYYLYEDGKMASDTWVEDYYVDENGVWIATMKPGKWVQDSVGWRYQNKDGNYPCHCWKEIECSWYYFDDTGYLMNGWQSICGDWYYFDPISGAMVTGWQLIENHWYYFHAEGTMQTGWKYINENWYYLEQASGAMVAGWRLIGNEWYYFKATGEMVTDWQHIGSKWYFFDKTGVWIEQEPVEGTYLIENVSAVTVEQMVDYFGKSGKKYPSESLEKGGAPDIETFCRIVEEEAQAEGIASEIVFTQAMLETGWLQFKGTVKIEQFNFAGLGATDDGAQGADFSVYGEEGVRMGIRAQVQHLKAYASAEITENTLQNPCVDSRFKYVKKGSVKYLEWLGQKENPEGYGWATSTGYGIKILGMIEKILALDLA